MIGPMAVPQQRALAKLVDNPEFEVPTSLGGELVSNGNFSSGTSGWGVSAGWSHVPSGAVYMQASASLTAVNLTQTFGVSLDTTKIHRFSFNLISVTGNQWVLKFVVGGVTLGYINGVSPHQGIRSNYYFYDFKPVTAFAIPNLTITVWTGSSTVIGIDDVSLKEATATKTIAVPQWYVGGIKAAKGSFDAPTEAASDWWIGE